jgi:hypothetical protein
VKDPDLISGSNADEIRAAFTARRESIKSLKVAHDCEMARERLETLILLKDMARLISADFQALTDARECERNGLIEKNVLYRARIAELEDIAGRDVLDVLQEACDHVRACERQIERLQCPEAREREIIQKACADCYRGDCDSCTFHDCTVCDFKEQDGVSEKAHEFVKNLLKWQPDLVETIYKLDKDTGRDLEELIDEVKRSPRED